MRESGGPPEQPPPWPHLARLSKASRTGLLASVEGLRLQDLITLRGTTSTSIIQSSTDWLELGDLEDIVLYLDVCGTTPNVKLTWETAPAALDAPFVAMLPQFIITTGLRTDILLASMAQTPPMRFIRWRLFFLLWITSILAAALVG